MRLRQPFVRSARAYHNAGLYPVPLPARAKKSPPTGFTGWKNDYRKATQKQLDEWLGSAKHKNANIALWLGPGLLGIDVDAYKKDGRETLAAIEADLGPLPDTWTSSARADGQSGIRVYRVPVEMTWPGKLGPGIETIHVGHRYLVAPPSIHPELTAEHGEPVPYQWYEPGAPIDGNGQLDPPDPDEFEELGDDWTEYLSKGRYSKALKEKDLGPRSKATKAVGSWIEAHAGEPCSAMLRVLEEVVDDFEGASAHDNVTAGFYRLACLAAEGHAGLSLAASRLEEAFLAEVERDDRDGTARGHGDASDEWLRARDGAVKKVMLRDDAGEFIGSKCTCTGLTPEGNPKPRLDRDNNYLPDTLELCYAAVAPSAATKDYGVYHTGGELMLLAPGHYGSVSLPQLRSIVARHVDWYRISGGEEPIPIPVVPPRDVLESMMDDYTRFEALPELRGHTRTPYWTTVDGAATLVHENGYHAGAKVFLDMEPDLAEAVEKMEPDMLATDVGYAVEYIEEMIAEFPFVGPADKATAYAALLLPFCRDLIDGPTPLHLFEAPAAGTGKGLLADAVSMVVCGKLDADEGYQMIGVRKGRERNEELAKEMTARMRTMPRVLLFDNISHTLDSPELASALTSYPKYQGRVLGSSASIEVANRATWMATANNLTASEEIRRRIVPCRLNAKVARPGERGNFKLDLYQWVPENRKKLVWAALTLIHNWVDRGAKPGRVRMGSFDHWAKVMSGILEDAGIEGLLANQAEFHDRSSEDAANLDGLVQAWADIKKVGTKVGIQELLMLEAVDDLVDPEASARGVKLGLLLKGSVDRTIIGYTIRKTTKDGRPVYYLDREGEESTVRRRRKRSN